MSQMSLNCKGKNIASWLAAVGLLIGVGLVCLLVVPWSTGLEPARDIPVGTKEVAQSRPSSSAQILEPEDWIERVAEVGSGVVRTTLAPSVLPQQELELRHQGPLSLGGREQVRRMIDSSLDQVARSMESMRTEDPGSDLEHFSRELRKIARYEELLIVREQLEKGTYLTLQNGDDFPPTSRDRSDYAIGPVGLERGGFGHVLFFVDRKRQTLRDLYDAIRETRAASREQRIREFNQKPFAERRQWVDRFVLLSARAKEDIKSLAIDEFHEFTMMLQEIRILGATVDTTGCFWSAQ